MDKISTILQSLLRLEEITLAQRCACRQRAWAYLPKKFHRVFMDCLHLPSMKELCIRNFDFPLSSLNGCNTIENLTLCGWVQDKTDSLNNIHCLALHSLTIQNCDASSVRALMPWMQIRSLRSLAYKPCYNNFNLRLFSELIGSCSNSLTSLYIDFGYRCTFHLP